MIINFVVNQVFDGWSPKDKRLGGTEESVVEWANRLASKGHNVTVSGNVPKMKYKGVVYGEYIAGGTDIVVKIPDWGRGLYLTNEVDATKHDLSKYQAVIWPSLWAINNIPVNTATELLPHGYDSSKIYPGKKIPKRCLYASSPDRGLDTLEQIWPSVQEAHPDAELIVTYGGHGKEYTEEEMNELYRTSDIWVHPCSGGELFGITAIKAQAAGCIPVYFPTMALKETVRGGIPCTDPRDMYNQLVSLLGDEDRKKELREGLATNHYVDWDESTELLESILKRYN